MDLSGLATKPLTPLMKGCPNGVESVPIEEVGKYGWNILREDLPFPIAVLKQAALKINEEWMKSFLAQKGAVICPHGKTTMSPQLFGRQLSSGAWGITIANLAQLKVCRSFGVKRVLMANQLIGKQAVEYVFSELEKDPSFEFYCLADSVEIVNYWLSIAKSYRSQLRVLIEIGYLGGRCGCRDEETAMAVARAVYEAGPSLILCGVEAYEGNIHGNGDAETLHAVQEYLHGALAIAEAIARAGYFVVDEVLLTAGGSIYYDIVVKILKNSSLLKKATLITRSGCYLLHDSGYYDHHFLYILARDSVARAIHPRMTHAIEIWSVVQSCPEPGLIILNFGKRDASYDVSMPIPLHWVRDGQMYAFLAGYAVAKMDDQHAFLKTPTDCPLRVGDLVCCGISHPCTTFDKWQWLPIVADDYTVVDAVLTFF